MLRFTFSELSEEVLNSIVKLLEREIVPEKWIQRMIALNDEEQERLKFLTSFLRNRQTHLMNEATIWSRAIYPLLMLAERGNIQAWAGVSLKAQYPCFELEGEADGALASSVSGRIKAPYLVVLEAKRGIDAPNPQFQLYGEMLAAAWLNWRDNHESTQEIFGCYTISDSWTFVHGTVEELEADKPVFTAELSAEYGERFEAETILQILKFIAAKYINESIST